MDNNSSDKTIEVIDKLKNPKIRLFSEKKNLWPYKWLNYLLDKAKWKYIAIQDHDDVWYKEKIEKQVGFLEKNKNYVWCWTWCIDYYVNDNTWYLIQDKECDDYLVYHTSLMFRNEWYRYDTTKTFLCDCYFMRYILCKNKKNLRIIPWIMSLHYNKKDWSNLSNYWFKFWWFSKYSVREKKSIVWDIKGILHFHLWEIFWKHKASMVKFSNNYAL